MTDERTAAYFDRFTPHFNPKRFEFALEFLNQRSRPGQRLLDVGCGDGATLALIRDRTELRDLTGLDVSGEYLKRAEENLQCAVIHGSILDDAVVAQHLESFDFCVLGAVLHHIIGPTRSMSLRFAMQTIRNSLKVLRGGGALIVFEPTFSPKLLMGAAFYIKKLFSHFSSDRHEIGRAWLNLGEPVVSYYTADQLDGMISTAGSGRVVERSVVDRAELAGVIRRTGLGLVIEKALA